MVCHLTAPSYYLNWLRISEVLWHSPENNFTVNTQAAFLYYEFEYYTFKITASHRSQWVTNCPFVHIPPSTSHKGMWWPEWFFPAPSRLPGWCWCLEPMRTWASWDPPAGTDAACSRCHLCRAAVRPSSSSAGNTTTKKNLKRCYFGQDISSHGIDLVCPKYSGFITKGLNHCSPMTLYHVTELCQYWFRWWLVAWWHQAIIWTTVFELSARPQSDPDRQNLGRSVKLPFFIIYKFKQNCALVRQVSDLILNTGTNADLSLNECKIYKSKTTNAPPSRQWVKPIPPTSDFLGFGPLSLLSSFRWSFRRAQYLSTLACHPSTAGCTWEACSHVTSS